MLIIFILVILFPLFFVPKFTNKGKEVLRNYIICCAIYLVCASFGALYVLSFSFRLEVLAFVAPTEYHQDFQNSTRVPLPKKTIYNGRNSLKSAFYYSYESKSEIEEFYKSISTPNSFHSVMVNEFKIVYEGVTYDIQLTPSTSPKGNFFRINTE